MAGPKTTTQKKTVKKAAVKTAKAKAAKKFVYMFTEGSDNKELFGGKGANLMGMIKIGLPVPPGFTVSTEACTKYYADGQKISAGITAEILENVKKLEKVSGKKFGDVKNPLLVSVRSGSRASMPGMMDTVLNLGINDQVVDGLANLTGNVRFAYDCYRRFIQMFSDVVMGLEKHRFEKIIDAMKAERGIELDTAFSGEDLKEMVVRFKAFVQQELGRDFPQDPIEQLIEAIKAVFRSWMNHRAIVYRRMHDIPESWGTAVNVQSMVFGNMGETSGTGVAFSRNPSTGENKLYGEYLMNAQGEDVVAGIRTPNPIAALQKQNKALYEEFVNVVSILEANYHDMQDMEFTIEKGKLFMLQTRNGKRTAQAALKIAVDMVEEGKISKEEALMKIDPKALDTLLHPTFDPAAVKKADVVASGLPASPGAASGGIVFDAETAKQWKAAKKKCILVRLETSPEDIEGMEAAEGILTARGGMTSHAAVVARGMGTACVAGCGELKIDEHKKTVTVNGVAYNEGQDISIDGSTGKVYMEILATVPASLSGNFGTIMSWTDEFRALGIRANADSPKDAATAYKFGARGIGLCRTEHMFFAEDRIPAVREMIVAQNKESREIALAKLLPMQRKDFIGIFTEMKGNPCTIRFLDPPLHEFLPHDEEGIQKLAGELGLAFKDMKNIVSGLVEQNPMMGHRGLRLAITYPEIAVMQTKAVIEAALKVQEKGMEVRPEIMIPLTCEAKELKFITDIVRATANEIIAKSGQNLDYKVGTMIEIPRACLLANEIAKDAEFFSFGTNDLTQMTYGFSRDDAGKFLPSYYENKIFENDPFARLDQAGVGKLVETACKLGKSVRKDIKLGICGEHGGEPTSIEFCHKTGLSYVSCSPFRVPIARLAAAQANIKFPRK